MFDTLTRRRGLAGSLGLAIAAALAVPLAAATPAAALGINEPPVLPHSITSFPVRDFVSAEGFTPGQKFIVEVWRGGVRIGASDKITADTADGLVEVNHPGGGCWVGVTPDIRAQDRIVVHPEGDAASGDATTTSDVVVTQPATEIDATTVTVKGTAAAANGAPLPLADIESRLINPQLFANGNRRLQAPGDGVLSYDAPGSTAWTATFTGLGAADVDKAVASETRVLWLGDGTGAELTIYEFGQVGGPSPPCNAPLSTGPSAPDMTSASDTGASNADNVTSNASPSFNGVLGNAAATSVNLYVDGVVNGTTTSFGAGSSFTVTPTTPLADGPHTIRASEVVNAVETMSASALSVTVDQAAPAPPGVTGTLPATTGSTTAPGVKGNAEPGSTVTIFGDAACTAPASGTGSATQFGSTGVSATVAAGSTSTFFAQTTDLAGNVSACSTSSATYAQDSVPPANPTIDTGPNGLVNVTAASFTFSDPEPAVSFQCSLDGAAFSACTSPKGFTALGQGAHSLGVRAVDSASNLSDAASASWTVDSVAPTTSITSPVGATINDSSPAFHFSASEAGATFVCSLDGSPAATCADGQTYGSLADGAHSFTATATDPALNTGPAATYAFALDTVAPEVGIDSTPPNPTNDNTPNFTYSSSTAGVTFTCSFALSSSVSPAFALCPGGSFTPPARADGAYRFTARATDAAGNVGSASTLLTIDTTPPQAPTITSRPAPSSSVTTPSFGFTSTDPAATFQCSLTPGPALGPCATGEQYGPLTPGAYTFRVLARDAAGNVSAPTIYNFTVTTAANPLPTVTARTPAVNATAVSRTANLTATFSEAVTGVGAATFTLRTGTATTSGTPVTATSVAFNATTRVATFNPNVTLAADTKYTATLTSGIRDSAGQSLVATSWTFTTGPRPTVTGRSPASGAIGVARAANVTATFSENVTGVSATTVLLRTTTTGAAVPSSVTYNATTRVATLNPGGTNAAFRLSPNTRYTVSLTTAIQDAGGNPIAATTWTFTTGP